MTLNDRKLRPTSRLLMTLPIAALAFSLAACAGAAPRPAAEDVADGLQKVLEDQGMGDTLTDPVVLCLSKALVDSKVSDATLNAIAKGDKSVQSDAKEGSLVQEAITGVAADCATAK